MTMSNLGKLAKNGLSKKIHAIRNSRCKNLTDEQIEEILLDVEKEVETCLSQVPKFNAKLKKKNYANKGTRKESSQKPFRRNGNE